MNKMLESGAVADGIERAFPPKAAEASNAKATENGKAAPADGTTPVERDRRSPEGLREIEPRIDLTEAITDAERPPFAKCWTASA